MTRKEAIEKLELMRQKVDEETYRALILAIKALEQEPTEKPMCDRNICISNEYNGIGCDECIVNKVGHKPCRVKNELNVELNELKPCTDAVSREAVIYYIKGHIHEIITESGTDKNAHTNSILRALINGVETMPSVTQKSGKWIEEVNDFGEITEYHCSKCYEDTGFTTDCKWKFCPNCGAKMESEGEK